MKSNKIVVFVTILTMLSYLIFAFVPVTATKSYAADMQAGTLSRDINGIDEGIYPGYKSLIQSMQSKHPNYTFLVYYTGMDWNEVVFAEYQGHGNSPLNLVQVNSNYNGLWICPICGNKVYDNGSWCCSSMFALEYMMDPRNSINDNDIFQFKDLSGSDVSYNDIARVVSGYGSYINNNEVIQAIVDASNIYNINGYFLVAKIVNEHGKNGSTLSNGQGYNGKYAGIYNYFNIGAYGNGTSTIINNGLSYAQNQGWNSRRAAILGGTAIVKQKYMIDYSQNTFYYQKFNVSGRSSMASHQYQQNIMAAQSQGTSLKSYYVSDSNHTFIIPLFKGMSAQSYSRPNQYQANSVYYENGRIQNINTSLKMRLSPNGTIVGALNNNESIKIITRATSQVNGYYWDLIVSEKTGTFGYAARSNKAGTEQYVVSNGTSNISGGSAAVSVEPTPIATSTPTPTPTPTPVVINIETDIVKDDNSVKIQPEIQVNNIKEKFGENVVIKDKNGNDISGGEIGTGCKIIIDNQTYTVVKKGDVTGDGEVNVFDVVKMLNFIQNGKEFENEYKVAAMVKNTDTVDIFDVITILKYIDGLKRFEL